MHQNNQKNNRHVPVLSNDVLHYLDPKPGNSYLDLTAGYGGHAETILARTKTPGKAVMVDRDQQAINDLTMRFKGQGVTIRHQDYYSASRELLDEKRQFDVIMVDLGVSSPHLNQASRGFSIALSGPLDMRMDQSQELTAAQIVNTFNVKDLAEILRSYGEEPKSRQIASAIIRNRPITTTDELADIVARAWPGYSKVHPATRTFQALRIAVNDELGQLEKSLPLWIKLLNPGGRIAVISFHSLEDRLVKKAFQEAGGNRYDAELNLLTKHPLKPGKNELVSNPRARSAKLRAAVKK